MTHETIDSLADKLAYRTVKTSRLYEQIVQQVEDSILKGQLKPGDQLPAERDLAQRFGVSRTAVREAVKTLREKGLVEAARKRAERWRRIAHESCQQARRLGPPEINGPVPLGVALTLDTGLRYFLDEQPGAPPLLAAIPPPPERRATEPLTLLTGPEGGWTDAERAAAIAAGWAPVSLGPLILRAETAAIAAAALLTHAWWASQLE